MTADVIDHIDWGRIQEGLEMLERDLQAEGWRTDAIFNPFSGLGDPEYDRHESTAPSVGNRRMAQYEIDEQYQFGRLGRRLIEAAPRDCTRAGWRFQVGEDDRNDPMAKHYRRLNAKQKFREGHSLANLTGGAGVFMSVDDDRPVWEPINMKRIGPRGVKALHVFDRWELVPNDGPNQMLDWSSGSFDEPETYRLNPHPSMGLSRGTLTSRVVHRSRIIRFEGEYVRRERRSEYDGWGQPLIESLWKPIRDFETAVQAIATTIHEFKYGVLKLQDLKWLLTGPDGDSLDPSRLMERLKVMVMTRSMLKALVLDADNESYETRELDFSGMDMAFAILQQVLSAASYQSLTKLFGQSPKGFTSEDETGQENWRDHVSSKQEQYYYPGLMRIAEIMLLGQDGELPDEYDLLFNPQRTPTDEEKAATYTAVAAADEKYYQMGVLAPDDMHTRFENATFNPDLVLDTEDVVTPIDLKTVEEEVAADEALPDAAPEDEVVEDEADPEPTAPPSDLVSLRDAADAMGVTTHAISALCRSGRLRFWKLGRHRRVSLGDVMRLGRESAQSTLVTDADDPRYMLAVFPPPEFTRQVLTEMVTRDFIDVEDVESGIELPHITLVYLGRRSEDPEVLRDQIRDAISGRIAAWTEQPQVKVSGSGIFFNGTQRCTHLLVSGVRFSELRAAVYAGLYADDLLPSVEEHGFIPSMTLRYFESHEEIPEGWETIGQGNYPSWSVTEIHLVREGSVIDTFDIGMPIEEEN